MKPFSQWTDADVALHNSRVSKENMIGIAPVGCEVESELHNQILDECRRRGWIALHGSMASPTRRTEGEPDFIILHDGIGDDLVKWPGVLFVECKTRLGKLSPAQQAFKAHAAKLGHTVHVVRSFQEFLSITGAVEMAQEGGK